VKTWNFDTREGPLEIMGKGEKRKPRERGKNKANDQKSERRGIRRNLRRAMVGV